MVRIPTIEGRKTRKDIKRRFPWKQVSVFYALEIAITLLLFLWLFHIALLVKGATINVEDVGANVTFLTLGILAYTFGLRHAVDPDHLAAIDNSTRKLIQEEKPAHFTGLFFSLGHSTIVIVLSIALMIATRLIASNLPELENIGSILGTLISGGFLYIIGLLNFLVLLEIYDIYKQAKNKELDENKLNEVLLKRGFMNKYFGKLFKIVDKQYYLYPIGVLFGLGFDTASETALLAISAAAAGIFLKIPLWNLLVFPFLFTAGMTLIDTTDGLWMNTAYGWAFSGNPLRKIWYNLTMTVISILIACLVGTLELLGIVQSELNLSGSFWEWIAVVDGEEIWTTIGIIIIGIFTLTWLTSFVIYKIKIQKYEH